MKIYKISFDLNFDANQSSIEINWTLYERLQQKFDRINVVNLDYSIYYGTSIVLNVEKFESCRIVLNYTGNRNVPLEGEAF